MQIRELFLDKYENLKIHEIDLVLDKLKGYYKKNRQHPNGIVYLNENFDYYVQNGALAEEIGHHETSYGNLLGAYNKSSKDHIDKLKQEHRAKRFGYQLAIPLDKLISCYRKGLWGDLDAMCHYIEVDRQYFAKAIEDYKKKYGEYVAYKGYLIHFQPLMIRKL